MDQYDQMNAARIALPNAQTHWLRESVIRLGRLSARPFERCSLGLLTLLTRLIATGL
jgi:hypothetical protein